MSMQTMTFQKMREETPELYPEMITSDLQETINRWFDSRHVCNDTLFPRFFQRILYRDYGRYMQLLRIEPGISEYDWLVQTYREHEITSQGSKGITKRGSGAVTTERTTHTEGEGSDTTTYNVTDTKSETGTDTHRDTHVVDGTKVETRNTTQTNNLTSAFTGETSNTSTTDTTEGTTSDVSERQLTKAAPMSNSYSGAAIASQGAFEGMPASLSWDSATSQGQGGTKSATDRDLDSTVTDSGSSESSERNTGTIAQTGTVSHDDDTTTTTNGTATKEVRGTNAKTGTLTKTNTSERDTTDDISQSTTTTGQTSETGSEVRRIRYTGRDIDTATLLTQAAAFIERTSAWDWLKSKLEICFMGVYDI